MILQRALFSRATKTLIGGKFNTRGFRSLQTSNVQKINATRVCITRNVAHSHRSFSTDATSQLHKSENASQNENSSQR
jgi:hypothetical protein